MNARRWATMLAVAVATVLAIPSFADEGLPTAAQVIEKYINVTGGQDAYEKHYNSIMTATLNMPAMNVSGKMTVWAAKPDKSLTVVTMQGIGESKQGCNGTVVWSIPPGQAPRIATGEEREVMLRAARFNPELHWRDLYEKAECVGTEDVDGQTCYKVVMTPKMGSPTTVYYGKDSGLIVKTQTVFPTQMGSMPVETFQDNYTEVDGVKIPFQMTQKMSGIEQQFTVESMKYNQDIPGDKFGLPDEIKQLLEKKEKEAPSEEGSKEKPDDE